MCEAGALWFTQRVYCMLARPSDCLCCWVHIGSSRISEDPFGGTTDSRPGLLRHPTLPRKGCLLSITAVCGPQSQRMHSLCLGVSVSVRLRGGLLLWLYGKRPAGPQPRGRGAWDVGLFGSGTPTHGSWYGRTIAATLYERMKVLSQWSGLWLWEDIPRGKAV